MLLVFLFVLLAIPALQAKALTISPVRIEISGDPGASSVGSFKAINPLGTSKTYFTNVVTFDATDESGNPTFRLVRSDLASWINVTDAVTLGPYESKDIPFSISVPKGSEPGGYFAAIFLTEAPPQQQGGDSVSLSSQVGTLVLFRVNGDIQEGADILEFDAKNHQHWFNSLPVTFYFRFQNSGQSWVKPVGDVVVENFFHHKTSIIPANKVEGNVLPQSIRRFETSWAGPDGQIQPPTGFWQLVAYQWRNFAFGPYNIHLNIAYGAKTLQGASAQTTVWIFPWQLSLVSLIAAIILFFIGRTGIKRYNRWIIRRSQRPAARRA